MKFLLIEDDNICADVIEFCITQMFSSAIGFEFRRANTLSSGRELWITQQPHTVLLDLHLPDSSGEATVATAIQEFSVRSDVVIISGDKKLHDKAFAAGASDWLDKEFILRRVVDDTGERFKLMDLTQRLSVSYYRAINGPQKVYAQ